MKDGLDSYRTNFECDGLSRGGDMYRCGVACVLFAEGASTEAVHDIASTVSDPTD